MAIFCLWTFFLYLDDVEKNGGNNGEHCDAGTDIVFVALSSLHIGKFCTNFIQNNLIA